MRPAARARQEGRDGRGATRSPERAPAGRRDLQRERYIDVLQFVDKIELVGFVPSICTLTLLRQSKCNRSMWESKATLHACLCWARLLQDAAVLL